MALFKMLSGGQSLPATLTAGYGYVTADQKLYFDVDDPDGIVEDPIARDEEKGISRVCVSGTGSGGSPVLVSLTIDTMPELNYTYGDSFDIGSMKVIGNYTVSGLPVTAEVLNYSIISPDGATLATVANGALSTTRAVTHSDAGSFSVQAEGISVSSDSSVIVVTKKLTGVEVATKPSKLTYSYGETLNVSGMIVKSAYSDGTGAVLNSGDYTVSPTTMTTIGTMKITVTYSGFTDDFNVIVSKATPSFTTAPAIVSGLTYDKNPHNLITGGVVNGGELQYAVVDRDATPVDGNYSTAIPIKTNAGNYDVYYRVVGDDYYENVDAVKLQVSIAQATPSFTTTPAAVTGLSYTGAAQSLITAGAVTGGTLQYAVVDDGVMPDESNYGTSIPIATNAGNYDVYYRVTGDNNYASVSARKIDVSIAQATVTLVATPATVTLDTDTLTKIVNIAGNTGNSALSVSTSDGAVSTATVDSTSQITISHVNQNSGTAKITVTCAATTNYAAGSVEIPVSAEFIPHDIKDATPAQVQAVAQQQKGRNSWAVGDTVAIKLNGTVGIQTFSNETYYAFIIGFDHNHAGSTYGNGDSCKSASGEEGIGIHFQFGKSAQSGGEDIAFVDGSYGSQVSTQAFNMNTSNTNSGGWSGSHAYKDLMPQFLAAIEEDWRKVIAACPKWTDNTGGGNDTASYVTETNTKIFYLAEFEIQGAKSYANTAEKNYQMQYEYYKNGNSKIKKKHNATGAACSWWTRSPCATNATYFCNVGTGGYAVYYGANYSRGAAPGFKIG